jgi:hypothetical protein
MPSTQADASLRCASRPQDTPAGASASPAFQLAPEDRSPADAHSQQALLAQASGALWTATLSLMTAFMQTPAPAHRYLIARRISRNLDTLAGQDCFQAGCRSTFARLALRWQTRSQEYAPRGMEAPPLRARWFDLLS